MIGQDHVEQAIEVETGMLLVQDQECAPTAEHGVDGELAPLDSSMLDDVAAEDAERKIAMPHSLEGLTACCFLLGYAASQTGATTGPALAVRLSHVSSRRTHRTDALLDHLLKFACFQRKPPCACQVAS